MDAIADTGQPFSQPPVSHQPLMSPEPLGLPHLRQELEILPAPPADDGAARWMLFDPVRNAFHTLSETALAILSVWEAGPAERALHRLRAEHPDIQSGPEALKEMTEFLFAHKLTRDPPGEDPESFARQEAAQSPPLYEQIIHKYLYFRIPLVRPRRLLNRFAPMMSVFFHRQTWIAIALIGVIGLYFAGRQWEQFVATFLHFFTLEGFIFYGLTLIIIKALHELGHAFTAHHFGAKVPIIGVAFLVMFPVLYTDTTDAWRLTDRRARLLIDSGGMIVELGMACLSIFLWSFLPEGPARSAAFFAATTSWTLSLLVNLNPCMRFDGYYLLGDFFKVQNLQKRGFEMGRWVMRETLFGLNAPQPFAATRRRIIGLCTYAYFTWVYRFFLFIGIAILVHHIFPKAIGIVLFSIEILWFIVLPIWREIQSWWSFRMTILSTTRGRGTLLCTAAFLAAIALPWQSHVRAPALIRPALQTEIYPSVPAYLDQIYVEDGTQVEAGEMLMRLSSSTLQHDKAQSEKRLALLEAQLARRAARLEDRRTGTTLEDAWAKERTTLEGIKSLIADLDIRAPHAGIVSDLTPQLHAGRSVTGTTRLLRLVSSGTMEIIALPPEQAAHRIQKSAKITFIADDPMVKPVHAVMDYRAPTAEASIHEKLLTSHYGGPLAVLDAGDGTLSANRPVFKVRAHIDMSDLKTPHADSHASATRPATGLRAHRGIAKIEAKPESPATALWRSVSRVLIRETDF